MHDFDTGDQDACAAEGLEAEHRARDSFDGPVVLRLFGGNDMTALGAWIVERNRVLGATIESQLN